MVAFCRGRLRRAADGQKGPDQASLDRARAHLQHTQIKRALDTNRAAVERWNVNECVRVSAHRLDRPSGGRRQLGRLLGLLMRDVPQELLPDGRRRHDGGGN
jgi:hypothetical protein